MKIHGNTIHFKSDGYWYAKEKSGKKPNTVRLLDPLQRSQVEQWFSTNDPAYIRIVNKDYEWESFERILTDVSCVGQIAGYFVYVFSWYQREVKHEEG